MALIMCPDCNKEISDKAQSCIHCGCPLKQTMLKKVILEQSDYPDGKVGDLLRGTFGIDSDDSYDMITECPSVVIDGVSAKTANEIATKLTGVGAKISIVDSQETIEKFLLQSDLYEEKSQIQCPKCSSTQINAGARGFSILTGFIGSGNTVITCLKCGWKWKPGK